MTEQPQEFRNRKEVSAWLIEQQWKVSPSTFYKHCTEGRLRPEADGTYKLAAVLRYARRDLQRAETAAKIADSQAADRLKQAEIENKNEQAKLLQIKRMRLEGALVPRADIELQLAGRAAALDAGLKYALATGAADLVGLVGGSHDRQQDLVRRLHTIVDEVLDDYAQPLDIEVVFEGLEEVTVDE